MTQDKTHDWYIQPFFQKLSNNSVWVLKTIKMLDVLIWHVFLFECDCRLVDHFYNKMVYKIPDIKEFLIYSRIRIIWTRLIQIIENFKAMLKSWFSPLCLSKKIVLNTNKSIIRILKLLDETIWSKIRCSSIEIIEITQ